MVNLPSSWRAIAACLCLGASAASQYLHSQAFPQPGNRLAVAVKLNGATPGINVATSVAPVAGLTVSAPASVQVDARGYALVALDVVAGQNNLTARALTLTLAHPSFSGGQITKSFLLEAVNGTLGSAWPEFVMAQGVFCNPATSAANHLQIDRATDLDGDGIYGDNFVEAVGRDALDSPAEFASDVDLADTATGCIAGTPPNVFQPGGGGRTVAFMADNRQVVGACNFTTQLNFTEDLNYAASFGGSPALFSTSSSEDTALIGRDRNGDGAIDATEIGVFFAPKVVVNNENYSPDGIALDPTAPRRAYWISDKSGATGSPLNQGVFRLTDTNGDDTIGAGEFNAAWTGTTGVVVVEGQNVDHTEFECLHVDGQGGVLVNQTALGTIFRWRDANNNGVAESSEVLNWLTYAAASTFTRSGDFQTAGFPTINGPFFALNLIESVEGSGLGGGDIYYVASTNSQTQGQGNGFVYRCEDRNIDGDVNDVGEVTVFASPSQIADPTRPEFISGMDVGTIDLNGNGVIEPGEEFVYLADADGNNPRPSCGFSTFGDLCVWRLVDRNGDGDAVDADEVERVSIHPTGAFNRGLEVLPPALRGGVRPTFYQRSGLVSLRPAACATGEVLEIDFLREKLEEGTQGTPFAGNARFALQSRGNGTAIASGFLLSASLSAAAFPFNGCQVWVGFPFFADLIPATVPDASGVATFPLPVPAGTVATLYLQAFAVSGSLSVTVGETAELRVR